MTRTDNTLKLRFCDNPVIQGRESSYETIDIITDKVLESWRESLFSYEWMHSGGALKTIEELSARDREKRRSIEEKIKENQEIERPILGIGLAENIEIGSGKAVFLTLAALGYNRISVHIPGAHRQEFEAFLTR